MDPAGLTFLGGLVLGLASTIHCSAMCGGISCSALLSLSPGSTAERLQHGLLLQVGRLLSYCALGVTGAVLGSAVIDPNVTMNYRALQWIGAVVLMWTGLAMAGMMPRLAILDSAMGQLSDAVAQVTKPLGGARSSIAPVALGVVWGLNPCPMVYGAVFTASLTGSALGGLSVMAGFGLGTVPGVLASGLGLSALKGARVSHGAQVALGVLIALLGFGSLYVPAAQLWAICLTN